MMNPEHDQDQQREYWAKELDAAHAFMMRVQQVRFTDCSEPADSLRDAAADAGIEVQFSDKPFAQTMQRQFFLRRGLIRHYVAAAREMNERGWVMKVEDAYRSPDMQKALQRTPALFDRLLKTLLWETRGEVPDTDFVFRRLLTMIAFCPIVGTHISASAIDISVIDRDTGTEIDRGAPYLTFGAVTPMNSPYVSDRARENRRAITALMNRHGFLEYPWEFWHYNQQDSYDAVRKNDPSRARYGPVHLDPATGQVTPVANPTERLNSPEEINAAVRDALRRLHSAGRGS